MKKWGISGATTVTPDEVIYESTVIINGDKIEKVSEKETKTNLMIDIDHGVLVPGLINSHDHLIGNYFPKVGNGPYENWLPWDNDLKSSPVYEERQQIENRDLYLLAGYRNLISGVTSVSDHIPHFVSEPFLDIIPTQIIREYSLAHSISSFALLWGDDIEVEYKKALDKDAPFITHIAEGFDSETLRDIQVLDKKGGLGDHSVLVHGLAFSDDDIKLIAKKGASVVWCADSNMFMFNRTGRVREWLNAGVNVCIGTDSPMSGGEHLLYEMKFDREYFREFYNKELPNKQIVMMVTSNPAKAFRLKKNGKVKSGYYADLTIFANKDDDPYKSVVDADLRDVKLVVIKGQPVYGDIEYRALFDSLGVAYQEIVMDGVEKIVIGDLLGVLRRISRAVGFKKEFPFMPVEFEV
ncbi:MAG TPA: amidohydrolase family protein [Spirochaetota bacterium]|nr:amidohydrolase family protein [Spirochaetota bacterium]HPQ53148.1 amidohydrolase family protein [Spirochaetota bacterium]